MCPQQCVVVVYQDLKGFDWLGLSPPGLEISFSLPQNTVLI